MDPACTWWPLPWMSGCLLEAPGEPAQCSWAQSCQKGPGRHHQQHLHSLLNFSPAQGPQCPQPRDHKGWRWAQGQGRVGDRAALGGPRHRVLNGFFH